MRIIEHEKAMARKLEGSIGKGTWVGQTKPRLKNNWLGKMHVSLYVPVGHGKISRYVRDCAAQIIEKHLCTLGRLLNSNQPVSYNGTLYFVTCWIGVEP